MSTSSVIFGNELESWIDPATLKLITSAPGAAFASITACRSDPAPASLRFTTLNVLITLRTSSCS